MALNLSDTSQSKYTILVKSGFCSISQSGFYSLKHKSSNKLVQKTTEESKEINRRA